MLARCVLLASLALSTLAEDDITDLDKSMPDAAELEQWLLGFNALRSKHGDDSSAIFAAYNRFHDTKKSNEQALGLQEMRALLKDIGVGNMVLRTAIVEIAFVLLDSSGDGRVSEAELRVALGMATCILGPSADPTGPKDAVTAPVRRLEVTFAPVGESLAALQNAVREEVHGRCGDALRAWWDAGWLARLIVIERDSTGLLADHSESPAATAERLVGRMLSAGKASADSQPADAGTVRTALKQLGVQSLLARHAAAALMLQARDADGDKRLSAHELLPVATRLCSSYAAVAARKTTVAALVRALSLPAPYGYPPDTFLDQLRQSEQPDLATARAWAAAPSKPLTATDADVAEALVRAYVTLAPEAVLKAAVATNDKAEL